MQTGQATVTEPIVTSTETGMHRLHPLQRTTWTRLRSGAGMSAQRLAFPDLRQGTDEDFGWSVDLPCSADTTWHPRWENRNSPGEAGGLGSTGFAFDQRLACSDEDWHSGRVAR